MNISTGDLNRKLKIQYARGAHNSLGLVLDSAIHHNMSAEGAMQLLIEVEQTLNRMVKKKDYQKPFTTRAVCASLESLGVEGYDAAYERIAEKFHKVKHEGEERLPTRQV